MEVVVSGPGTFDLVSLDVVANAGERLTIRAGGAEQVINQIGTAELNWSGITVFSIAASSQTGGRVRIIDNIVLRLESTTDNTPHITYTGNAGSYTVEQFVDITCTAMDDVGVVSTTCADVRGISDGSRTSDQGSAEGEDRRRGALRPRPHPGPRPLLLSDP